MCAFSASVGDTNNMCLLHADSAATKLASYCGNNLYPLSDGYPKVPK